MSEADSLREMLHPLQRLALSYAPSWARAPWEALLALDNRLAGIVRNSHEPSLAQLRLAWWREQLRAGAETWPRGEPLLTALRSWQGHHPALGALVDGWEHLTGPAPLPEADLLAFAEGRAAAFAALAGVVGAEPTAAFALGRRWALADLARNVAHPEERATALGLLAKEGKPRPVSRALRPLVVLHGLATTRRSGFLRAVRLGLFGR